MKNIKKFKIIFLVSTIILILVGCEFTTEDFSVICDDGDANCNEYNCDYDDESCNGSGNTSNGGSEGNSGSESEGNSSSEGGESSSGSEGDSGQSTIHPQIDASSVGKAIADYAYNLYKYRNKDFKYISPSAANADKYRVNTYNNVKSGDGYLYTDCNGFVSYVIHMSAEIGPKKATSVSQIKFAYPSGSSWKSNHKNVKKIASGLSLSDALEQAVKGDLLASNGESTHIQIYIGNGQVIEVTPAWTGGTPGCQISQIGANGERIATVDINLFLELFNVKNVSFDKLVLLFNSNSELNS